MQEHARSVPTAMPYQLGRTGVQEQACTVCRHLGLEWEERLCARVQGGESEALARLAEQLSDKGWVAAFEKPKGDPAAFDPKPATTILSPYLKFGCLSARLFYESLQQVRAAPPPELHRPWCTCACIRPIPTVLLVTRHAEMPKNTIMVRSG